MLIKEVFAPVRRNGDGEFFLLAECSLFRDDAIRSTVGIEAGAAWAMANPIVRVGEFRIEEIR